MARLANAVGAVTTGLTTVAGISTLLMVAGDVYLWVTGQPVPEAMLELTWALIGAHLGLAIGTARKST